jgi:phytoene dehydrogenase-like protein
MPPGWDVIVVGAGPGGALAARKCAGNGLRFQEIEAYGRRVGAAAATKDPEAYADALIESWDYALKAF